MTFEGDMVLCRALDIEMGVAKPRDLGTIVDSDQAATFASRLALTSSASQNEYLRPAETRPSRLLGFQEMAHTV